MCLFLSAIKQLPRTNASSWFGPHLHVPRRDDRGPPGTTGLRRALRGVVGPGGEGRGPGQRPQGGREGRSGRAKSTGRRGRFGPPGASGGRPPCGTPVAAAARARVRRPGDLWAHSPPEASGVLQRWGGALFEGRQMLETPWLCPELDGSGRQNPSVRDAGVGIPKRPCPSRVAWARVAMCGSAAICVIRLPNRGRQKKVGGCNICAQPRPHTYLARYMRGKGKKNGPKTTMSFRSPPRGDKSDKT
jgi:hypothetical protein